MDCKPIGDKRISKTLLKGIGLEQETGLGPCPRGVWRKVWGGEGRRLEVLLVRGPLRSPGGLGQNRAVGQEEGADNYFQGRITTVGW